MYLLYLPHNHKLHMYRTIYLPGIQSIDPFPLHFTVSLVYMGIRKCVCDILSTIGLQPRAKIILLRLQFTYLFLTHFTWVGNKKYQCTPFFKSLHSNKHFFACQNMYTRLLIQIWPIIKCSFAVCFSEGNSKEISQKCFKFFFLTNYQVCEKSRSTGNSSVRMQCKKN